MSAQIEATAPTVESTYKARDAEGILDVHVYRPIGFQLAQFFARLNVTPTGVSLLGGVFGVTAGHLYYYSSLPINLIGMLLHVFANTLDNADGQLARLTNQATRNGRIIDSVVDHFVFLSIYVHLALRYFFAGAPATVGLLALAAALSHGLQSAGADYYRNAYLYFTAKRSRSNFDSSADLQASYRALSWRDDALSKVLLALYLNYTRQQEFLSRRLKQLRHLAAQLFSNEIPASFQTEYQTRGRTAFRWWSVLMTNSRMFVLFVSLLIGQPIWYFWVELVPFNLLLLWLLSRQERMAGSLIGTLNVEAGSA